MRRLRPKDLAKAADDALIAASRRFTVNWFVGRAADDGGRVSRASLWDREEFTSLEDARAAVGARGCDEHGRKGIVYAITLTGQTIHVE